MENNEETFDLVATLKQLRQAPSEVLLWRKLALLANEGRLRDFTVRLSCQEDNSIHPRLRADCWSDVVGDTTDDRFPPDVYQSLLRATAAVLLEDKIDVSAPLAAADVLIAIRGAPEFHAEHLSLSFPTDRRVELLEICRCSLNRAEMAPREHAALIRAVLYTIYEACEDLRALIRVDICRFLNLFGPSGRSCRHAQICSVVEVLGLIVTGANSNPLKSETDVNSSKQIAHLRSLLFRTLLSLHATNEMTLWRDQTPVLEGFHGDLVYCVLAVLDQIALHELQFIKLDASERFPQEAVSCQAAFIDKLINFWPAGHASNTPKQVLLIHELEKLLTHALPVLGDSEDVKTELKSSCIEVFRRVRDRVLSHICIVLKGDNFRPLERALLMWKNPQFVMLLNHPEHSEIATSQLVQALVRVARGDGCHNGVPVGHWNPTVNRMTKLVLSQLLDADVNAFTKAANSIFGQSSPGQREVRDGGHFISSEQTSCGEGWSPAKNEPVNELRPALYKTKTPRIGQYLTGEGSTLTRAGQVALNATRCNHGTGANTKAGQPPLSVTGVAPWVFSPAHQAGIAGNAELPHDHMVALATSFAPDRDSCQRSEVRVASKRISGSFLARQGLRLLQEDAVEEGKLEEVEDVDEGPTKSGEGAVNAQRCAAQNAEKQETEQGLGAAVNGSCTQPADTGTIKPSDATVSSSRGTGGKEGLEYVLDYIQKLACEQDDDTREPWHAATMASTPTLLPSLYFHDLVWGNDLGSGAFSTVRYARQVVRGGVRTGKARSTWPEFAVKCIKAEKIRDPGVKLSVAREVAMLRMLSHPGIARMVSAFMYRGGAYLVLEYASLGDLHSLVVRLGTLPETESRFVAGSVAAAVLHLHDLGFVYGDLKPENILLTKTGHVKISDFGSCRPVSSRANDRFRRELLEASSLRTGDWKEKMLSRNKASIAGGASLPVGVAEPDVLKQVAADTSVEGTAAYLAPEMINGAPASTLSDAFALGCVLYRCIAGKPCQWGVEVDAVAERQVHFAEKPVETQYPPALFTTDSRLACTGLLHLDPSNRLSLEAFGQHDFFKNSPTYNNMFTLHMLSQRDTPDFVALRERAAVASVHEEEWNQRAYSKIWAPLPTSFGFGYTAPARRDHDIPLKDNGFRLRNAKLTNLGFKAILEGQEQGSPFNESPLGTANGALEEEKQST